MEPKERVEKQSEFKFCIDDLKFALEHVDQKYITWTIGNIPNDEEKKQNESEDDIIESYCERVFAYELYHQFRKIMCDNRLYTDYMFNGEQLKDNRHFKNLLETINHDKVIPDLILHQYIGTPEFGGQIMYIEIKTIRNKGVCNDLEKLSSLTNSALNFVYYIFIYVDATMNDLEEIVERLKNNELQKYNKLEDSVLCICIQNYKAESKSIKEIKEKINNNNLT